MLLFHRILSNAPGAASPRHTVGEHTQSIASIEAETFDAIRACEAQTAPRITSLVFTELLGATLAFVAIILFPFTVACTIGALSMVSP